jgi:hypothetical protein
VSALLLGLAGLALVFAPDAILRSLEPRMPDGAYWMGQLLGAAWLGVAALNWHSRRQVLGGIYGRPIVLANVAIYLIGGLSALGAARRADFPPGFWWIVLPCISLGLAYLHLMFRGPWSGDTDRFGPP